MKRIVILPVMVLLSYGITKAQVPVVQDQNKMSSLKDTKSSDLLSYISLHNEEKRTQSHKKRTYSDINQNHASLMAEEKEDTAYYRAIIRKYQWYEGQGDTITKEQAFHLPYYFRMTKKNCAGHWQHVEAMCGDTLTTNHNISCYILDKYFNGSSEKIKIWAHSLSTTCQWYLTSSLNPCKVAEERAYDAENNIVYSYMPTPNANGRIIGCYNDKRGLPISMNSDDQNIYGCVVNITMDQCGRDSIIDFIDAKGMPQYNIIGVAQQRICYDNRDRVVSSTSHNIVGDSIYDLSGIHGSVVEYDDSTRSCTQSIKKRDFSLPSSQEYSCYKFHRTFDEYGRLKTEEKQDSNDRPLEIAPGISRKIYIYNEHEGRYSSTGEIYYDINGNVVDSSGIRL